MNLAVDIGNSYVKIGIFDNNKLTRTWKAKSDDFNYIKQKTEENGSFEKAIVSSVGSANEISGYLSSLVNFLIELNSSTPLPIKNSYKSKSTLGNDRIANAVGANNIYPNQNVLVIDAGTAITYDFVTKNNIYIGGNISPGIEMRFKALHHFTSKLPELNSENNFMFLGNTTESAIISGVQNGVIFEVEGYIERLKKKHEDLVVVFTGGDAYFFDKRLKNSIFVDLNLTLTGLNRILEYNAP